MQLCTSQSNGNIGDKIINMYCNFIVDKYKKAGDVY